MSNQIKRILPYALLALPMVAAAQNEILTAVLRIQAIVDAVVPIVLVIAFIYFVWGVGKYILSAGDEEKKSEGRNIMIYGALALFVIASIWGIVGVISRTLGTTGGQAPNSGQLTPQ
ncbi:MAG: hypothetical protein HYT48_02200 [Candidatus Vogelbacteria bacterium]|nr:hypothetical protein [Candidatus Vogelbacteria bacterium]